MHKPIAWKYLPSRQKFMLVIKLEKTHFWNSVYRILSWFDIPSQSNEHFMKQSPKLLKPLLFLSRGVFQNVFKCFLKKMFLKNLQIHMETPVQESLL